MHAVISRVETFPLSYSEPHYNGRERSIMLVRITTTDGVVGWGEANTRFHEASQATATLIDQGFGPRLLKRDPVEVETLWQEMCDYAFWFGVEGIAAFAISALDMALWDLKGKIVGSPVAQLLGEPVRTAIPAAAAIIFDLDDLDWTLAEFGSFAAEGYRVVKGGGGLRPGALMGQDRARDTHCIGEIRGVIGDDVGLVVDVAAVHGLWDLTTAIERITEWEPFGLRWVEQPLRPSDLGDHVALRAAVRTPIGTGEDEWSPETYRHLIDSGGADVVQMDPGRCLGLTGCREVAHMVAAAGLTYTAHSWSSAINTAASLSLLAISDAADTIDFKPHESSVQHELVDEPWDQTSGEITLRDIPGLGVAVDEHVVRRLTFG